MVRKMHASSVADSNMAVDLGGFASQTVRYAAENKLAGRCEEDENDDPTGSCRKAELEFPVESQIPNLNAKVCWISPYGDIQS